MAILHNREKWFVRTLVWPSAFLYLFVSKIKAEDRGAMVQKSLILGHLIIHFPTSLGVNQLKEQVN